MRRFKRVLGDAVTPEMGRTRPFVTFGDFSSLAACYAELNGRVRISAIVTGHFGAS